MNFLEFKDLVIQLISFNEPILFQISLFLSKYLYQLWPIFYPFLPLLLFEYIQIPQNEQVKLYFKLQGNLFSFHDKHK